VLALFLPAAAALYMSAEALNPKGTDQVIQTTATALKVLPIAASHPAQLYLSGSLTLLALGALAVSYPAIATLVRNRGWVIATVAALLGGIGAFCGALVNVLVGINLAAAATAHMTQDAAARFLVTTFNSGSTTCSPPCTSARRATCSAQLHRPSPAPRLPRRSAATRASWMSRQDH
jgi:hypothetical protein